MSKEKICKNYLGFDCLNGNCPITLYYENSTQFERRPTCENCFYYKGCENCIFKNSDLCAKAGDKNE